MKSPRLLKVQHKLLSEVTSAEYKTKNRENGCEQAIYSLRLPHRLILHQSMNSPTVYPDFPPEKLKPHAGAMSALAVERNLFSELL